MNNLTSEEFSVDLKDIQSGVAFGNELSAAQTSDMRTHTRVTFRRITKTSRSTVTGKKITFVQSSRVSTSRSWSGPGIEGGTINDNGHAVLSLDLINAIPASSDLFGWVNNLDAFIKDNNIGFDKAQVDTDADQATDYRGKKGFSSPGVKNTVCAVTGKESEQEPARNQGACGTKLLRVSHLPSFSHMEASL